MRNLKRALSLALAAVMVLGMMVIGAGAMSVNDFADIDEIDNKEAVALLVDLGVLEGLSGPNGTTIFDPDATLQRQAMAKIAYMVATGATDWDLYATSTPKFTDVNNSWAKGAIEYCNLMGYITGNGDGTFSPDGLLTVSATATILLRVLGYDNQAQGYNGDSWMISAMRDAKANGLLNGVSNTNAAAPISRQDACQMAYNALFANTVTGVPQYDNGNKYIVSYTKGDTLGEATYGLVKIAGTVVGNDYATLDTNTTFKAGQSVIAYTVAGEDDDVETVELTLDIASGADLLGHQVYVYTSNGKVVSSALVESGATKVTNNVYSDATAETKFQTNNKLDVTGAKYSTDYAGAATGSLSASEGNTISYINSDGKGAVEYVVVGTYVLSNVKSVNATKGTFVVNGLPTLTVAKCDGAADLAEGDYVIYHKVGNTYAFSKAESVTGTVTALRDNAGKAVIGGKTYTVADEGSAVLNSTNHVGADDYIAGIKGKLAQATEVTFYLDNLGRLAVCDPGEADVQVAQYAYVTALRVTEDDWTHAKAVQAKIVNPDGTQGTVDVVDISADAEDDSLFDAATAKDASLSGLTGKLYSYTLDSKGNYKFVKDEVKTANEAVVAYKAGSAEIIAGKVYANANTTVLFYSENPLTNEPIISSYTGVKNLPNINAEAGKLLYVSNAANELYADFIMVMGKPAGEKSTDVYGFVVDASDYESAAGKVYSIVVNGESVEVTLAASDDTEVTANTIYSYTEVDGIATLVAATDNVKSGTVSAVGDGYVIIDVDGTATYYTVDGAQITDLTGFDTKGNVVPTPGSFTKGANVRFIVDNTDMVAAFILPSADDASVIITVGAGNTLTANILGADGFDAEYSWKKGDTAVDGADEATYTATESASYTVTVTLTNKLDSTEKVEVTSDPTAITVAGD